jgi:hypothetical protein
LRIRKIFCSHNILSCSLNILFCSHSIWFYSTLKYLFNLYRNSIGRNNPTWHLSKHRISLSTISYFPLNNILIEIWLFRGWANLHISLMQGKWMLYSPRPTLRWILPNEIFWPSLFTKLLFQNISGVIYILFPQHIILFPQYTVLASVVRLSVLPVLTFHSMTFSSEIKGPIRTKLGHHSAFISNWQSSF